MKGDSIECDEVWSFCYTKHKNVPDEFQASASDTGTGMPFAFDRLGVRVPAVLISPWIEKGTVIDRTFEHASIPATVMEFALGPKLARGSPPAGVVKAFDERSPREKAAATFLDFLSRDTARTDAVSFRL